MKKLLFFLLLVVSLTACKSTPQNFVKVKSASADRVQIESAYLTAPGYIIIREIGTDTQPGPIIGQSILYPIGALDNKIIATATLRPGQKYLATIRVENGDFKFTEALDVVAKNKKGQEVVSTFTAK